MLTDYFQCYKLNNKSTSLPRGEIFPKLKGCQIFVVIKFCCIQILVFINFKQKKVVLFLIFKTCIPVRVSANHVGCYLSLNCLQTQVLKPKAVKAQTMICVCIFQLFMCFTTQCIMNKYCGIIRIRGGSIFGNSWVRIYILIEMICEILIENLKEKRNGMQHSQLH